MGLPLAPAAAQTEAPKKSEWYVEVEGGAQYDSVVSLDELDLSSDQGDEALLFDATVGYERPFGDTVELDISYNLSVLDYREFSEVDQLSHVLSADLKKDLGKLDIGLTGFYINSNLDRDSFLELARVSPYVSGFFAPGWFARGGLVYSDKTNDVNADRDATAAIGEIDLYHFPEGEPWFVNIGYKYRDEDATSPQFDYLGNTFKARYVHRMTLLDRKARFEIGFRRLDRDYRSTTPSIGAERFDQRDRATVQFEVALNSWLDGELFYTYSDWESNLPSVDFHQHLAGFRMRYRWVP